MKTNTFIQIKKKEDKFIKVILALRSIESIVFHCVKICHFQLFRKMFKLKIEYYLSLLSMIHSDFKEKSTTSCRSTHISRRKKFSNLEKNFLFCFAF